MACNIKYEVQEEELQILQILLELPHWDLFILNLEPTSLYLLSLIFFLSSHSFTQYIVYFCTHHTLGDVLGTRALLGAGGSVLTLGQSLPKRIRNFL